MKIRRAFETDIDAMSSIIGRYAGAGLMLPRTKSALLASINEYVVADLDGSVVGCGGLHPYTQTTGEIYGLAALEHDAPHGTGRAIVTELIENARAGKLTKVFALTLVPGFFEKLGFRAVDHLDLPMKVWKDCVACPKFGRCDEIAMIFELAPSSGSANERLSCDDVLRYEVVRG